MTRKRDVARESAKYRLQLREVEAQRNRLQQDLEKTRRLLDAYRQANQLQQVATKEGISPGALQDLVRIMVE